MSEKLYERLAKNSLRLLTNYGQNGVINRKLPPAEIVPWGGSDTIDTFDCKAFVSRFSVQDLELGIGKKDELKILIMPSDNNGLTINKDDVLDLDGYKIVLTEVKKVKPTTKTVLFIASGKQ